MGTTYLCTHRRTASKILSRMIIDRLDEFLPETNSEIVFELTRYYNWKYARNLKNIFPEECNIEIKQIHKIIKRQSEYLINHHKPLKRVIHRFLYKSFLNKSERVVERIYFGIIQKKKITRNYLLKIIKEYFFNNRNGKDLGSFLEWVEISELMSYTE